MTRTHHHRGQRNARKMYEVWSRRCRKVSMWSFSRFMKRETHRFERREGRAEATRQLLDALFRGAHTWE